MKKLMVMLSAAAMAFGLFAEPTYKTSFETGDDCVSDGVFTADGETWSGYTAPITLKKDDAKPACYGDGDYGRREEFDGLEDAHQYLPLETGKDTLNLAKGDVFLDQIVKFTGFEEAPTDFGEGTKIAVWMSAIEDDPDTTEVNEGETNLYVAVGSQTGTQNVKLIYDVEPETWYRLTIKKLENPILAADGNKLGGFIIYINGEQVGYDPTTILYSPDDLSSEAKSYAAAGQLFPAMVADETFANTFASVGYNGIGAIDDIVIDATGPKFAQFVEGTVAPIPGSIYELVLKANGEEITVGPDGKFSAQNNAALEFICTAINGYFFKNGTKEMTVTGKTLTKDATIDITSELDAKIAVAQYTDETTGGELFAASLKEALDLCPAEDEIKLLTNETLTATLVIPEEFGAGALNLNGYTITLAANANVGIDVQADGVTISGGEIKSALTANKAYSKAINIPNKNVTLEDVKIDAAFYEYAIYANCDDDCVEAGDRLEWFYNGEAEFATLACNGVEITGNGSLFHVEGMVANLTDCSAVADGNPLFGAAHQAAVYSSLNSTTTISGEGTYTHVNALQSGNLGGKIIVAVGSTAEFTGNIKSFMKVGAHDDLVEYDDYVAQFTFNAGTYDGEIVFVDATARDLDFFQKAEAVEITAPEGYKWDDEGILVACDYVCEIGDNKYESFTEAWNAAKSGDTITLLADIPNAIGVTSEGKGAGFTLTIDFNAKKYTVNKPGAGSPNTRTQAFHLSEGGTFVFKNGTIECSAENKTMTWAKTDAEKGIAMIIQNYANLTLEGMTIDGANIAHNGVATRYVMSNNSGAVVIENTTITANSGDYAFDTCKYSNSSHDYPAPTVEVKGTSLINGDVELSGGNLTLTAGELNGVLVASAIGSGVITKAAGFTAEPPEGYQWNPTTGVLEPIPAGITINVTLGTGIASVTVDDQVLTASGEVTLDEAGEVTITLAADNSFTIPVFKVAQGALGANVTPKTETYTVADGDTFTFTVEEAKSTDPQVTEEQKKAAIIDAIDEGESHDAAVAKVNAVVTTETTPAEGKVTATELAGWIKDNGIHSADLAACDYVVASVKLGTDTPINKDTDVEVATVDKTSSDLAVTIQVDGKDATKEQIESFVQVCDDLGVADGWEKLPESTLKSAVKIEAGKLVITPVAGVDKLFLKVVIPQDAN